MSHTFASYGQNRSANVSLTLSTAGLENKRYENISSNRRLYKIISTLNIEFYLFSIFGEITKKKAAFSEHFK